MRVCLIDILCFRLKFAIYFFNSNKYKHFIKKYHEYKYFIKMWHEYKHFLIVYHVSILE